MEATVDEAKKPLRTEAQGPQNPSAPAGSRVLENGGLEQLNQYRWVQLARARERLLLQLRANCWNLSGRLEPEQRLSPGSALQPDMKIAIGNKHWFVVKLLKYLYFP
jgi:hypothetical protein